MLDRPRGQEAEMEEGRDASLAIGSSFVKVRITTGSGHCNRGLLCRTCNVGIGNLQDSIEILKSAIKYLERTSK